MAIRIWEASSDTRLSCFISGLQPVENMKKLGTPSLSFYYFVVFGTPDETLKIMFKLLHQKY